MGSCSNGHNSGAGRYIPGSSAPPPPNTGGQMSDPLTGAGRYVPNYNSSQNVGDGNSIGGE